MLDTDQEVRLKNVLQKMVDEEVENFFGQDKSEGDKQDKEYVLNRVCDSINAVCVTLGELDFDHIEAFILCMSPSDSEACKDFDTIAVKMKIEIKEVSRLLSEVQILLSRQEDHFAKHLADILKDIILFFEE